MLTKKNFRIIRNLLTGFQAFVALYLLSAFLLSVISVKKEPGNSKDVSIYILTNGDHTDLVVPVNSKLTDWSRETKYENTIAHDTSARYLAIGWGDKGFT